MIENSDGTITFKNKSDLKKYVRDKEALAITQYRKTIYDSAVNEVAREASKILSLFVYETLHLEFGFGKKERLPRFLKRYNSITECYENGLLSIKDLEEQYKDILPTFYKIY